jgi:transcriptional antiterminator RfaH
VLQIKDMSCCCEAWYLIHCQPRKEKYASQALESQLNLCVFLPEYKLRARGGVIRNLPFFPGYIFARADLLQVSLSRINTTPGVIRLVAFGDDPQPVPLDVIGMLNERLNRLDQVYMQSFQPGDVVRVKREGSLQDLEMIFVGSSPSNRRVTVLLNFLGRLKEVQLDIEMLEKVTGSSSYENERYIKGTEQKVMRSA